MANPRTGSQGPEFPGSASSWPWLRPCFTRVGALQVSWERQVEVPASVSGFTEAGQALRRL